MKKFLPLALLVLAAPVFAQENQERSQERQQGQQGQQRPALFSWSLRALQSNIAASQAKMTSRLVQAASDQEPGQANQQFGAQTDRLANNSFRLFSTGSQAQQGQAQREQSDPYYRPAQRYTTALWQVVGQPGQEPREARREQGAEGRRQLNLPGGAKPIDYAATALINSCVSQAIAQKDIQLVQMVQNRRQQGQQEQGQQGEQEHRTQLQELQQAVQPYLAEESHVSPQVRELAQAAKEVIQQLQESRDTIQQIQQDRQERQNR